jgi:hypothetical protein
MNYIHIRRFGFATGLTSAVLYLGCMIVMLNVGHDKSIKFFNSMLHGLDVTSIVRMDIPLWEELVGIAQTFVLGWLIGALIAAIYNATLKST